MSGNDSKRAAVVGWPVAHSLSPRLHGFWLRQYEIDGSYEAIATEPENLAKTLKKLAGEGYQGVNLTLPHKEAALKYVDEIDNTARRIGAVNTIVMRDGRLIGSNTDAYGFMQNIKNIPLKGRKALVLGAGGASRAVCAGLLDAGAKVVLANRTPEKAQAIAEALGGDITPVPWTDIGAQMKQTQLLVNTTSLGMQGQPPLDISLATLPRTAAVTDIVYRPLMTPLLRDAQASGHTIVDGLGMLLWQAQPGFEAWFGVKPEVSPALRAHVLEAIA